MYEGELVLNFIFVQESNSVNSKVSKIPFEFSYKYEDSLKNGIGFANLFLSDKKLSKVVVKYDFDFYQGMFVLGFNQNRCKKIKFAFTNFLFALNLTPSKISSILSFEVKLWK